jgi:Calcineurin-like phosphoesterase
MLFGGSETMSPFDSNGMDLEPTDEGEDKYGLNARPDFTDMTQLMDLPPTLLPETGKHRHSGRLVIVGDVHGMKESLINLLDKVKFDEKHDHLILAGDMISKGPDSPGVVDLAMKLGATGVRGNHEDRTILAYDDMMTDHLPMDAPGPSEERDKSQDALEEVSFNHGDYKDRALVRALGEKRIKWLKKCPVILRVGKLGSLGEVVVVHAGLAPGVALKKQDPFQVMNMRTIKDGVPSEEREGLGWMMVRFTSSQTSGDVLTSS